MTQRPIEQLDKVLALADSSHEGEALGALRMLRRMLEREGIRFGDLVRTGSRSGFSFRPSFFSVSQAQLETQIEQLQDDIDAHVEQNASLSSQLDFWRQRAQEMEQKLNLAQAETARWKEMARETAERLWDIGQMAHAEALMEETQDSLAEESDEEEGQQLKVGG